MAKQINLIKAGCKAPFADGGLKLSKFIQISNIEPHEKFKELFPIDENLLDRIAEKMQIEYDGSQPIHIWKDIEDDITHYYLIDGYTRVAAAKKIGLESIPYYEHTFSSFDEAYEYVLGLQVNRRNLDSSDLLINVSKLYGTDFIQNAKGKKSKAIAEHLGVSPRTVEKTKYVLDNASEETLDKINANQLTINQSYNQLKEKNSKEKEVNLEQDEIEDDIDDVFDDEPKQEKNSLPSFFYPKEQASSRISEAEDIQRTKERKESYLKGVSDGFYKALVFACSEIYKGRTPQEVYKDERVSDLSTSEIEKFELPDDAELIISMW